MGNDPSYMSYATLGITVLLTVIGYLIVRTLRQIDLSQQKLWEAMDDTRDRLAHLEGEHKAMTGKGGHEK